MDEEIKQSKEEWNELHEKVKMICNLLTRLDLDFKKDTWNDLKGVSIIVEDVSFDVYLNGKVGLSISEEFKLQLKDEESRHG